MEPGRCFAFGSGRGENFGNPQVQGSTACVAVSAASSTLRPPIHATPRARTWLGRAQRSVRGGPSASSPSFPPIVLISTCCIAEASWTTGVELCAQAHAKVCAPQQGTLSSLSPSLCPSPLFASPTLQFSSFIVLGSSRRRLPCRAV